MTDQQINNAIAVHLGITRGVPDFTGDLNEMHEAESTLHRNGPEFSRMLLELVGEAAGPGVLYAYGSFSHVHAPARLRAEAFLRTLGKWEEVQK